MRPLASFTTCSLLRRGASCSGLKKRSFQQSGQNQIQDWPPKDVSVLDQLCVSGEANLIEAGFHGVDCPSYDPLNLRPRTLLIAKIAVKIPHAASGLKVAQKPQHAAPANGEEVVASPATSNGSHCTQGNWRKTQSGNFR